MKKNIISLFIILMLLIGLSKAYANVFVYESPSNGSAILNTNARYNTNRIVTYSPKTRVLSGNYNPYYLNSNYNYNPQRIHRYNPYGEHIVGYDYDSDGRVKAIRTITNYNPPIYRPMYHNQPPQYSNGFGVPNYMGMPHNTPRIQMMQNQNMTGTFNWKL